jgi:hypothetical protein
VQNDEIRERTEIKKKGRNTKKNERNRQHQCTWRSVCTSMIASTSDGHTLLCPWLLLSYPCMLSLWFSYQEPANHPEAWSEQLNNIWRYMSFTTQTKHAKQLNQHWTMKKNLNKLRHKILEWTSDVWQTKTYALADKRH